MPLVDGTVGGRERAQPGDFVLGLDTPERKAGPETYMASRAACHQLFPAVGNRPGRSSTGTGVGLVRTHLLTGLLIASAALLSADIPGDLCGGAARRTWPKTLIPGGGDGQREEGTCSTRAGTRLGTRCTLRQSRRLCHGACSGCRRSGRSCRVRAAKRAAPYHARRRKVAFQARAQQWSSTLTTPRTNPTEKLRQGGPTSRACWGP